MKAALCGLAVVCTVECAPVLVAQGQSFRDASHLIQEAPLVGSLIGASAADVNSDGLVDLYHPERLFIQQPDGTFLNQWEGAGLADEGVWVFGAIFGDYTNDGFLDLFIEDLNPPSHLFRNRGDGAFVRSDPEATGEVMALTQGSVWGDFNADDKLDLFVGSDDGENLLYLNEDFSTFRNATLGAGITLERNSYGVAASDYDRDGDLDVFIAACSGESERSRKVLLQNDGQGKFTDVAFDAGVFDDLGSWAVVWADIDNDGWQDLFIANMPVGTGSTRRSGRNHLYLNDRHGRFLEIGFNAQVWGEAEGATFGAAAADFDNDGWIDLVAADRTGTLHLHRNLGNRRFAEVATGMTTEGAVAVADIDGDGWIDLHLPTREAEQIWLNEGGTNHWIGIQARGTASNHFGVGARVDLYAGGLHQVREITAGDGMTSQNHNLEAHFGLGTAALVDSVVVRWPNGQIDRLANLAVDQRVTVVEGVGVNQMPAPFRLTQPADEAIVVLSDDEILFAWEAAGDPDSAPVNYTVRLTGPSGTIVREGLKARELRLDVSLLQPDQPYTWTVTASDGYSIRRSLDRFRIVRSTPTAIEPEIETPEAGIPAEVYPHPFREDVTIRFELDRPAPAEVRIYDLAGREVRRLFTGHLPAGRHHQPWEGRTEQGLAVAPGLYFVRIVAGAAVRTYPLVRLP